MADLEELKRAAEAATPGLWVVWSSPYEHMGAQLRSADGTVEGVALAEFYRSANGFKNAEFARIANPATILALISRLEEAEKALEPMADAYAFWSRQEGGVHDDTEIDDQGKLTFGDLRRAHAAHKRQMVGNALSVPTTTDEAAAQAVINYLLEGKE